MLAATSALGESEGLTGSLLETENDDRASDEHVEAMSLQHIRIIDYEYGTMNDVAFDVANHWCEYAADYHGDEAHVLHFDRLPTKEQKISFARQYIDALWSLQEAASSPNPVRTAVFGERNGMDKGALAALLVAKAEAYEPLSHLKWGLWGVLQAEAPETDFEYLAYAQQRLAQYHVSKQRFLQCSAS